MGAVQHGKNVTAMGHLHGGSVLVTVEGDDLYAITLQLDCNFFTQFT